MLYILNMLLEFYDREDLPTDAIIAVGMGDDSLFKNINWIYYIILVYNRKI